MAIALCLPAREHSSAKLVAERGRTDQLIGSAARVLAKSDSSPPHMGHPRDPSSVAAPAPLESSGDAEKQHKDEFKTEHKEEHKEEFKEEEWHGGFDLKRLWIVCRGLYGSQKPNSFEPDEIKPGTKPVNATTWTTVTTTSPLKRRRELPSLSHTGTAPSHHKDDPKVCHLAELELARPSARVPGPLPNSCQDAAENGPPSKRPRPSPPPPPSPLSASIAPASSPGLAKPLQLPATPSMLVSQTPILAVPTNAAGSLKQESPEATSVRADALMSSSTVSASVKGQSAGPDTLSDATFAKRGVDKTPGLNVGGAVGGLGALEQFVAELPRHLAETRRALSELESRRIVLLQRCGTRDAEQELNRRVGLLRRSLELSARMLEKKVDEAILRERLGELRRYHDRIPAQERSARSLQDSWNAIFDVNAVVGRTLAKNHCDRCKRPLLNNRRMSLLTCTACARVTEQLATISQGTTWLKNSQATQPENKRIRNVTTKLSQFRAGGAPIPPEVVLGVRHWLKSRDHTAHDAPALPTPVAAALHALGFERYVPYAFKIAILVNDLPLPVVTDDQINEILNRLRAIQAVFQFLQGKVERLTFYTNFFVAAICQLRGWDSLAACFPGQRTRKIITDQQRLWRILVFYLRQCDSLHVW